ncbi:MAG: UdgX family uracil-DNA binding protein [Acidobacteriales bacterium]|nr:UdgX family uracil-DNA binding protein [Terriglobales bacterium]
MIEVTLNGSYEDWHGNARRLVQQSVPPSEILWSESNQQSHLFAEPTMETHFPNVPVLRVPRAFVMLAKRVAAHRDPAKWSLLYSVLWRITHGNHDLLKVVTDDEVLRLTRMDHDIGHEIHRMHAFVRFQKLNDDAGEIYVAWFRPEHRVLRMAAPFFADRFASMRWSILTPEESAHWDGASLEYGPGVQTRPNAEEDDLSDLWQTYYRTTYNPARTNLRLMRSEMPVRYWKDMPELNGLAHMLEEGPRRVQAMVEQQQQTPGAASVVPASKDLTVLRASAAACRGCELYKFAKQTVFGEGPPDARVVLVGEQPGDREDLAGHPFVGPAGEVLNRAMKEAGLDREQTYVTNAVKHFAFVERGKRRIHRTPRYSEIIACRPWMEAEIAAISPAILVCLGATAARAIFGNAFRLTSQRGAFLASKYCGETLATFHPSAILRAETEVKQKALFSDLVTDLTSVAGRLLALSRSSA